MGIFKLAKILINFVCFYVLVTLRICLRSAYFTEIENFLLKVLSIKVKVS